MTDWERVEEALNRLSFVSGEPDYSLAESAKEALFRMGSELLRAERDRDEWKRIALMGKQLAEAFKQIDEILEEQVLRSDETASA